MIRIDDRTQEQKQTHTILVVGTDAFMSGWEDASDGASYAAWACKPEDHQKVLAWVDSRHEMKRVRVAQDPYRPSRCAHLHIYYVDEQHNALA